MIAVNGICYCHWEQVAPVKEAPEKQSPVIFPVAVKNSDYEYRFKECH